MLIAELYWRDFFTHIAFHDPRIFSGPFYCKIVASFLIKDLHINWRCGEKYFAQQLVDYDPAVNNGNWQWCAGIGCDMHPYFRIFNPWRQQKIYDPDCLYIKRWIPELAVLSSKIIHTLHKITLSNIKYPKPIINHETESRKGKMKFKQLKHY